MDRGKDGTATFESLIHPRLVVVEDGVRREVEIDAGAQVLLNGLPARLSTLIPGDEVLLVVDENDHRPIRVEATR